MPFFGGFAQSRAFGRGGAGKLPIFSTPSALGFLKTGQTASTQLAQVAATVGAGDPPVISYSIVSGSLPAGVTFNSNGTWSGTVGSISSIETRTYTIRVTSAAGFTDGTFTIDLETTPTGQAEYTTPGTYTWTAPTAVRSVCVVCVGGGGGGWQTWANSGGSGGGLGWKNNIPVVPGQSYTVVVGQRGYRQGSPAWAGGNSYFESLATVSGYGGGNASAGANTSGPNSNNNGGGYVGDGGGAGGHSANWCGAGGAGGYGGRGGNHSETWNQVGGGGYGGECYSSTWGTGAGGGVGIFGQGPSGTGFWNPWAGTYTPLNRYGGGGRGGSSGGDGYYGENPWSGQAQSANNILGGNYGGGGGGAGTSGGGGNGGIGAVRVIWGSNRSFPSTNTGNL